MLAIAEGRGQCSFGRVVCELGMIMLVYCEVGVDSVGDDHCFRLESSVMHLWRADDCAHGARYAVPGELECTPIGVPGVLHGAARL
jgi:hypothetical protein